MAIELARVLQTLASCRSSAASLPPPCSASSSLSLLIRRRRMNQVFSPQVQIPVTRSTTPGGGGSGAVVVFAANSGQSSVENVAEAANWAIQDFYVLRKEVDTAKERVKDIRESAGLELLEAELARLEETTADSSLWDNPTRAQETLLALNDVKDKIKLLADFKSKVEDAEMIITLTEEMEAADAGLLQEASNIISDLTKSLDRFELTQLLSGPYDKESAILTVTAGAGGTDAQDWADMLLRMYVRWGEKQRYKAKVVYKTMGGGRN